MELYEQEMESPTKKIDEKVLKYIQKYDKEIMEDIKQTYESLEEEEREKFYRMIVIMDNPKLAVVVINYIYTTFNPESMMGELNHEEFKHLVKHAARGLYMKMFVEMHDESKSKKGLWNEYYAKRWSEFIPALEFMYLLFTRVYEGADRKFELAKFEAQISKSTFGLLPQQQIQR